MSPLPTPLNGQDADCGRSHVRPGGTNTDWICMLVSMEPRGARS
jgi:hypothetical protein